MTHSITDRATAPVEGHLAVRDPSRRRVLIAGGVIAAAGAASAACGSSGASESGGSAPGATDSTASEAGNSGNAAATIPAADIPVGGGQILTDQKVVVTQPTAGTFMAFTAVCTHQGCVVASIVDAEIVCPCHGSKFSIADGAVVGGPAPAPLAPATITVSGDTITLG